MRSVIWPKRLGIFKSSRERTVVLRNIIFLVSWVILSGAFVPVAGAAISSSECETALTLAFDLDQALGMRGFLSSNPEPNPENNAKAAAQGVFHWGHSIAVVESIEIARAHDSRFRGLEKIVYFISPISVSDLLVSSVDGSLTREVNEASPEVEVNRVQSRFKEIFESSDLVYFDDSKAILSGDNSIPAELKIVDRDFARGIMDPAKMYYFNPDNRGPRFSQHGWVFPQIRGVVTYQNVFESNSKTIKKIWDQFRSLTNQGYTVTFNTDFRAALEKAKSQMRLEKNAEGGFAGVVANSRYRDPETFNLALKSYEVGDTFSVELRDPQGRLLAGSIGTRNGNLISMETVFYDFINSQTREVIDIEELKNSADLSQVKSLIDFAKIAVVGAVMHFHKVGIDVIDGGMVTPFTAGIKGVYVSGSEFAEHVRVLNSRPKIDLRLSEPIKP